VSSWSATRDFASVPAIGNESASENGSTSPVRDTGEGSKNRPILGAIKGLFRDAVKALTRHEDEERPDPRRRRGETEGDFRKLARKIARRFDARKQFRKVAKNRAHRRVRTLILSPEEWGAPDAHLTNTLDLVNLWNNDMSGSSDYGGGFDASRDHISPGL
jgi:hypothetical protein